MSAANRLRALLIAIANRLPLPLERLARERHAVSVLRPIVNRLVPQQPTLVRVRTGPAAGIALLIDPRSEKFYWGGAYDRALQDALVAHLHPGDTYWDVGAHIGFTALLAARLVGSTGEVHAFEPVPENRERLLAAVRANHADNVTVHPEALASTPGTAMLHPSITSATWSLLPTGHRNPNISVQCVMLDGLAETLTPPHVLKIDVEGADIDVLRGGVSLIAKRQPIVLVEIADSRSVDDARALLAGYTFTKLDEHNWLCVPPGAPPALPSRSDTHG